MKKSREVRILDATPASSGKFGAVAEATPLHADAEAGMLLLSRNRAATIAEHTSDISVRSGAPGLKPVVYIRLHPFDPPIVVWDARTRRRGKPPSYFCPRWLCRCLPRKASTGPARCASL